MEITPTATRRRRKLSRWQKSAARGSAALLIGVSFSLMVLAKVRPEAVEPLRLTGYRLLAPLLLVSSAPVRAATGVHDWIDSHRNLRHRNQALEAELADQQALERTIARLQVENDRLRDLLSVTNWPVEIFGTVRVIGAAGGAFVRSVLVDAGARRGMRDDLAVVDSAGVVGRLISVAPDVSRVLLVTDLNSRVPVRIARNDETAILAGNNSDLPVLQFLAMGVKVEVGDQVLTSGHGGVFPPDLPIGVVVAVDHGAPRLRPYARLDRLRFLSVVGLPRAGDGKEPVSAELPGG